MASVEPGAAGACLSAFDSQVSSSAPENLYAAADACAAASDGVWPSEAPCACCEASVPLWEAFAAMEHEAAPAAMKTTAASAIDAAVSALYALALRSGSPIESILSPVLYMRDLSSFSS